MGGVLAWVRRSWLFELPEGWHDVPDKARRRWWAAVVRDDREALVRLCLRPLPFPVRRALTGTDRAAILPVLAWAKVEPSAQVVYLPEISYKRRLWVMPAPNGTNVCALEFAYCEDQLRAYVQQHDTQAALSLAAALWREKDADKATALKRADARVPLHSSAEVRARLAAWGAEPPAEMTVAALCYFAGLKDLLKRMYGEWIFEMPDEIPDEEADEDATDDDEDEEEKNTASTGGSYADNYPDFGWWGVLQSVAEAGLFGTLEQVYQTSIHDICIYLVRKRVEQLRMKDQMQRNHTQK